jgi:hypothetical protein
MLASDSVPVSDLMEDRSPGRGHGTGLSLTLTGLSAAGAIATAICKSRARRFWQFPVLPDEVKLLQVGIASPILEQSY